MNIIRRLFDKSNRRVVKNFTMINLIFVIILLDSVLSMRHDSLHSVQQANDEDEAFCDDGQQFLHVDWDGSPVNYTCSSKTYPIDKSVKPLEECQYVPDDFSPQHFCIETTITYSHILPTHEGHRPVWPVFGEYAFVPPQRWLHSVEHGAVVMLYHPCADPKQINTLRQIVVNCIRKHVITANTLLPRNRPLALVAWGCRMTMNTVDINKVVYFIKSRGMQSPEATMSKDGEYRYMLIKQAKIPVGSDFEDSVLCPQYQG